MIDNIIYEKIVDKLNSMEVLLMDNNILKLINK